MVRKSLANVAFGGILAAVSGCGGAAKPAEAPATPNGAEPAATPAAHPSEGAATAEKDCCKGKNECKGKGGCHTDKNSCKGKNECKAKGGCKSADCSK